MKKVLDDRILDAVDKTATEIYGGFRTGESAMADENEKPKPITTDEDELEMLKEQGISPTPPAASEEVIEKPEAADVPAKEEEKDPAEAAETPEGGGDVAKPADESADAPTAKVAAPPPEAVSPPPPPPAPPPPAAPATVDPVVDELVKLEAKIEADEFDPFSKEGKRDMLRAADLKAEIKVRAYRNEQDYYARTAASVGSNTDALKAIWNEEVIKASRKFGAGTEAAWAVAKDRFDERVEGMKAKKPGAKVSPPVAPTPITQAGARVVPPGAGGGAPPKSKPKTDEDELLEAVRKVPGGIRSLV